MLQLAACGGLWTEQRRYEAFLQDHAICPRCDIEIESGEHRFYVCKGNAEGDPDLVDTVAKTDSVLLDARDGLTMPDLRSFFPARLGIRFLVVEAPHDGPLVFLVADATHDGFHFGPGTYFTDGSKLYPDRRRREVGWGFGLSQLIFNCAQERVDQSRLITLPYQWRNSWQSTSWLKGQ